MQCVPPGTGASTGKAHAKLAESSVAQLREMNSSRAGTVRVQLMEVRQVRGSDVRVSVEVNSLKKEASPPTVHATGWLDDGSAPVLTWKDETLVFPMQSALGSVYVKVAGERPRSLLWSGVDLIFGTSRAHEVLGRACIPLNEIRKTTKHTEVLDLWLELLPPAINESPHDSLVRYQAISPVVYRFGLPRTMAKKPDRELGWIHVKISWCDRPSFLKLVTTRWRPELDPHHNGYFDESLDWYGNLFVHYGHRIACFFAVPALLLQARALPALEKTTVGFGWTAFCCLCPVYLLPVVLALFFFANGAFHRRCVESTTAADLIIFEEDNTYDPPTILETLNECRKICGGLQQAQAILGSAASALEKVGNAFAPRDSVSLAFASIIFLSACVLSAVLSVLPAILPVVASGWAFLFCSLDTRSQEVKKKEAEEPPDAVTSFFLNLWASTPDKEEYVHRRVSARQRMKTVPKAGHSPPAE
ncbi:hypothetical protein DIPPA_25596 [Diplonema papillatum]|nr:hypothetical protein DIPPA_25596 [Diplonema papillatum]